MHVVACECPLPCPSESHAAADACEFLRAQGLVGNLRQSKPLPSLNFTQVVAASRVQVVQGPRVEEGDHVHEEGCRRDHGEDRPDY